MNSNSVANVSLAKSDQVSAMPAVAVERPLQVNAGLFQLPAIWSRNVASSGSGVACLFLDLHISQNEEHTSLSIQGASKQPINLGERVHHYVLLLLARRKLEDAGRGLEPDSCGWIGRDVLAKMLGVEGAYVNILIHRGHMQFDLAVKGSHSWPALIERRRGEVRLGSCRYRIVRGSRLEGEFMPG
jgi:hypothetical protein